MLSFQYPMRVTHVTTVLSNQPRTCMLWRNIFKSLGIILTRAWTFGSCVLQQSDVGMSIELLAIQLLLFKTRCIANSSSNNLGRFALKISNCHSTIGIKFQLCTFCLEHCISTQFSAYPIFVHKSTRVILSL